MLRFRAVVLALTVVAGCAPVAPSFEALDLQGRALPVPDRLYTWIAWLSADRMALAFRSEQNSDSGVMVVDSLGTQLGDVTPSARPECRIRGFRVLGRTFDGRLGFTDQCESGGPSELNDFAAIDIGSGQLESFGSATARPYVGMTL